MFALSVEGQVHVKMGPRGKKKEFGLRLDWTAWEIHLDSLDSLSVRAHFRNAFLSVTKVLPQRIVTDSLKETSHSPFLRSLS